MGFLVHWSKSFCILFLKEEFVEFVYKVKLCWSHGRTLGKRCQGGVYVRYPQLAIIAQLSCLSVIQFCDTEMRRTHRFKNKPILHSLITPETYEISKVHFF